MDRTSFYDRLYEHRLAAEVGAREASEQANVLAAATAELPAPPAVTPLQALPSHFGFGGFELLLPQAFTFRDADIKLECGGAQVQLNIQRRDVGPADTLTTLSEQALEVVQQRQPGLRVVRSRDGLLAGNKAIVVDFHLMQGEKSQHGRQVIAIVPLMGSDQRQWLKLCTVVDPALPGLALWLLEFDAMLDGLAID